MADGGSDRGTPVTPAPDAGPWDASSGALAGAALVTIDRSSSESSRGSLSVGQDKPHLDVPQSNGPSDFDNPETVLTELVNVVKGVGRDSAVELEPVHSDLGSPDRPSSTSDALSDAHSVLYVDGKKHIVL